jgi:fluoroacetyl-CoA thioesterase
VPLEPGLTATVTREVSASDTATAFGSGDVPVLATPRVLALVEEAAVAAVRTHLDPGATSVGVAVSIDHMRATPVGAVVEAVATVTAVEGRRILFEVAALVAGQVVARGTHIRTIVDRETFLGGLG